MNNNVEILRAICFTAEDLKEITNLADTFTEKEIEFMVEFKKIYELGTSQLEKFIDKLDSEGNELDTFTINYYVQLLLNGPLGSHTKSYSKDKKYFTNTPDTMGMLGNKTKSPANVTIFENVEYPLGCSVDLYNRLPNFSQTANQDAIKLTENIFRGSMKSSSQTDNTLPIIDKKPQDRYNEEPTGTWVKKANGSFLVKDHFFYKAVDEKSKDIFDKVKNLLGDEDFRVYDDKKQYTPFDSDKNEATSTNNKIEKTYYDGDNERTITLNLMGDEFDSEDSRASKLKVTGADKDKEYLLNTVEGQLGN